MVIESRKGTFARIVAYVMDVVLASMCAMALLKLWILPRYHGAGLQVLQAAQAPGLRLSTDVLVNLSEDQRLALLKLIGSFQWVIMASIFLYFFLSETLTRGSSLGKLIFRMRIVNAQSAEPIGIFRLCTRTAVSTTCLTLFFPFLFINFLIGLLRRDRRCLHDLMAHSWVIRY
ncbi:MAG: RDD family protein [Puniceicoccales bacterium]|jgi:uncharacterized RDD family membrane protein YckC|nr:RDD family protein [Puniceicoccales bacterium]